MQRTPASIELYALIKMTVKNSHQVTDNASGAYDDSDIYDDDGHAKRTGKILYSIITNLCSYT